LRGWRVCGIRLSSRDLPFDNLTEGSAGTRTFPEEVNAYKDVVKAFPGVVTRLIMKFDPPTSLQVKSGDHLKYVCHCHILEHEDNEMMRPYDVVVP